jgi:hypothetical protein
MVTAMVTMAMVTGIETVMAMLTGLTPSSQGGRDLVIDNGLGVL